MMTHATVVVFLLVYRCLLPFILLRAQQRHHRFKEGGGKTSTRTKTILSSCIFSFILQSSSSVARHVPSRFRIIVGFQRARLFSRRRDFDDDDAEPRLLVLLFLRNAHEKYTVAAKNAKTTAFPSIAPGGFRALIASRPSLNNAILDCTFERQKCDAPETKRYKDVLLLRLLEYALSLFLSEEEDESGE